MEFCATRTRPERRTPKLEPRVVACDAGFLWHSTGPPPHGPSSFTVTVRQRKRSKQTCGGRESLTWWIAVISIRLPSVRSDWWRPLLTHFVRDWMTRATEWDLWPEDLRYNRSQDTLQLSKKNKNPQVILHQAMLNVNIFWKGENLHYMESGWWRKRSIISWSAVMPTIQNLGTYTRLKLHWLHSVCCFPPHNPSLSKRSKGKAQFHVFCKIHYNSFSCLLCSREVLSAFQEVKS